MGFKGIDRRRELLIKGFLNVILATYVINNFARVKGEGVSTKALFFCV